MKNLYKVASGKKFRGIFNTETADYSAENLYDELEGQTISIGGINLDLSFLASFAGAATLKGLYNNLSKTADEDDSNSDANNKSKDSDENIAENPEVKKTISKKYETAEFTKNILDNARFFIGLNEAKDGDGDREEIKKMHKSAKQQFGPDTAWCASFVSYVLQKSGVKISGSVRAKDFLNKGEKINKEELKKGDVIVYDRGGVKGHIGFFTGKYKGNIPIIIAGNTSSEVKEYAEKMPIVGYRRFI